MEKLFNVLITDDVHPLLLEGLENNSISVTYRPEIIREQVLEIIKDYNGIVINTKMRMDKTIFDTAEKLELIVRLGSGLDIIDLKLAKERGVVVYNSPEGNSNAVGEHALAMLLALFNNLYAANTGVKNMQWNREDNRGIELNGKTIGIIGFGNTGPAFAHKLSGFDVEILVYDKYKQHFGSEYRFLRETTLTDIMENADVISLHIPLTVETKGFIDTQFFKRCKKNIYLINTSRGRIVNTGDLIQEVESGKVLGACLDVLENEKPSEYSSEEQTKYKKLFDFQQVLLSPHIAGWTYESKRKIAEVTLNKMLEFTSKA